PYTSSPSPCMLFVGTAPSVPVFAAGLGTNNQILLNIGLTSILVFPAGAPGSTATASAPATASTVYSLNKNGTTFATVTYGAGSSTGVFVQSADANFANSDILSVQAPATADTTLAGVSMSISAVAPYGTNIGITSGPVSQVLQASYSLNIPAGQVINGFDILVTGTQSFVDDNTYLTATLGGTSLPASVVKF